MVDILYTLTALELFLGGGGRVLDLGAVTVRMLLFAVCLLCMGPLVIGRRDKRHAFLIGALLVLGFLITHLPSLLLGVLKGATTEDLFTDVSPVLYWLIAPFFAIVLRSQRMVMRTANLVQFSAVAMALAYVGVVTGLAVGELSFVDVYGLLGGTGEVYFRGEGMFFYKGFLYLGIGAIFLTALGGRWRFLCLVAVLAALVLTLTRGFILATAIAGTLMLWVMRNRLAVLLAVALSALAILAVWVYLPSQDEGNLLEQRDISNSVRFDDLAYLGDNIGIGTLLMGEGLGTYINGRLAIENSYLTILWKTGPAALAFWLLPFAMALRYYRRIRRGTKHYALASAFFFGMMLVYVQTATNPYLNNPIGLSFVVMAMFSLRTLAGTDPLPQGQRVRIARWQRPQASLA